MADWTVMDREWPKYDPYLYGYPYYQQKQPPQQCMPPPTQPFVPPTAQYQPQAQPYASSATNVPVLQSQALQYVAQRTTKVDNPREIRNKAEKQRRDKLNQSISELASIVPPVRAASRKIDKTGVLRLTAHYLRAHQYVFGDSIGQSVQDFQASSTHAVLRMLNGFLLTTTYRGIIVVVSQNVQEYLGYSELDLLGQNIFNLTHDDDRQLLKDQLMPKSQTFGPNGELLVPEETDGKLRVAQALAKEKRQFIVRFKKLGQRSEPSKYVTCHVEGSLRKSDRACRGYNRCCQMVRRVRARGDNPCSSGNDVVFIGIVRPTTETFVAEMAMESYKMEYRTRHSVDGEIIQCEQRISLVTGYMTHEVNGVNAMNFMHRDDVRWVIIALREMYDQRRLYGESCYRLMTKNGQFIYMRTRGRLDVDEGSKAVTTFVCTNTVVDEEQGKYLIKMMKKKFTLLVNNNDSAEPLEIEDIKDDSDNQTIAIEDPRNLEKVILHLVTNLPTPKTDNESGSESPERGPSPSHRLSIIPPKKERIVHAIGKIYTVIKDLGPSEKRNEKKRKNQALSFSSLESEDVQLSQIQELPSALSPNLMTTNYFQTSPVLDDLEMSQIQTALDMPLPKLEPYNELYSHQDQNSADLSAAVALCNQVISPEIAYIDNLELTPESNMDNIPIALDNSDLCSDGIAISQPVPVIKYQIPYSNDDIDLSGIDFDSNALQSLILPNTSTAGIKRPNENKDQNKLTKKKPGNVHSEQTELPISDTPLETFFDEATLSTQIESAISSLEQTIDPGFPDLLISSEVQDILEEIESDLEHGNEV